MAGTKIKHRGVIVSRRGNRWRFFWSPNRGYVTRGSSTEALAELDRLLDERDRSRLASKIVGLTIRELLDEWWSRKQREIRESTWIRYESVMRVHVNPKLGDLAANEVRPLDIEDYFARITHKTALVSRDVLRPAFKWGLANRLVLRVDGVNPLDLARLTRSKCLGGDADTDVSRTMQVDEKLIPTPIEIEKLMVDAEDRCEDRWWLYLRLAASLGARPGELCALRRSDFDDNAFSVHINRNANKLTLKVTAVKRPSSVRNLYVGPQLFEDIKSVLDKMIPDEYLFPATGSRCGVRKIPCWTANSAYGRLRRATKRLGLPLYTPHSFRHFCATHLLDQGWPAMQVARWLGHRNDSMIRLLYAAHVVEETHAQIGEAAAQLVSRAAHLNP